MNNYNELLKDLDVRFEEIQRIIKKRLDVSEIISERDWENCKRKYLDKFKGMIDTGDEHLSSVCLIDDIIASQNSNYTFAHEIQSINNQIQLAKENILNRYPDLKDKVYRIIRNIIISIEGSNQKNVDYRNHIAELYVFNYLCDCEDCSIKSIESSLGNGKTADFELQFNDGQIFFIDVVSLHYVDSNQHENAKTMSEFIDNRVETKYENKTVCATITNLYILPIVDAGDIPESWKIELKSPHCLPLMTIVQNTFEGEPQGILCFHNEIVDNLNKSR